MKKEEKIDDLTYDTIWMSMRFWMTRDEKTYPWMKGYPQDMVYRFWGKLSDLHREKQITDAQRELKFNFNKEYEKRLTDLLNFLFDSTNDYENNPEKYCQEYTILDEIDFNMLRMAILYACPRQTISCSMLPGEIIKNRYKLFSKEQIETILKDLNNHLDWCEENGIERVFGDRNIDDKVWKKFMSFLDETNRFIVTGTDGEKYLTFLYDNIYYSVERYIEKPFIDSYIMPEKIVEVTPL